MSACPYCARENREASAFCEFCGCRLDASDGPVARLTWVEEQTRAEKVYVLSEPERFVGRDSGNDVILDDGQASGNHMKIVYEEGAFWVEDLGSRNGTFVNGERVIKTRKLQDEDLIKVGQTILKFSL